MFIGLSVGIALGLILTPIFDNECHSPFQDFHLSGIRTLNSEMGHKDPDGDDFEPVLRLQPKPKQQQTSAVKTPIRSRYYSTELQIKEKLFVGVISDGSTIGTLGVAINKTLAHHVSKLVLFTDVASPEKVPKSLSSSVVSFVDERPLLKPFHVMHYIAEHFVNDYDFFLVMRDTTYIRGVKLKEMLSQLSVAQNVYMGGRLSSDDLSLFCDLAGGIVISNAVVKAMVEQLNWCIRNAVSEDGSDNVGRCILHSCNQSCRQHIQGQNFTTFKMDENVDVDVILKHGGQDRAFNASVSVYPVHDPETMYKLHLHFSLVDLDETHAAIAKLRCSIVSTNEYLPDDMRSLSWPIGTPVSTKPHDRFDNVRWHYFTETHIYLDSDLSNLRPLTTLEKEDISEVINSSAKHLEEKYHGQIVFERFEHGYRKFDPNRGMDYTVSLKFLEVATGSRISKRMKGLRPLSKVELVPVPYVTESTRVVIFLPVTRDEHDEAVTFLKDFAKVCLEKQDSTMLVLVLLHNSQSVALDAEDKFKSLKNLIHSYNNKYEVDGAKLSWTAVKTQGLAISDIAILDFVAKKFPQDTLILVARPGMEIRMDYLNRVRMNTISGWQVFFPIPFTGYHPEIVYQDKARPTTLELNKNYGHFDEHSTSHFSFYNSDYQMARKLIEGEVPLVKTEWDLKRDNSRAMNHSVFSMFLNAEHLHVLRGVEPALRLRFRETKCNEDMGGPESYQQCLLHAAEGIASRSQLATYILKNHRGKQMLTNLFQDQNRQDLEIER